MNINVLAVMAEYDRKADSYGRAASIEDISKSKMKKEIKYSTFSNNDELNSYNKRTAIVPKVGDQRTIVEYIDFYPIANSVTRNDKSIIKTLKKY